MACTPIGLYFPSKPVIWVGMYDNGIYMEMEIFSQSYLNTFRQAGAVFGSWLRGGVKRRAALSAMTHLEPTLSTRSQDPTFRHSNLVALLDILCMM